MVSFRTFADYGTLLFIRGLVYTLDGRSIVDTIGQRRFQVLERGTRDGYHTAKVKLIRDDPVEQHEFDGWFLFKKIMKKKRNDHFVSDLFQLNRQTYDRVRHWYDDLDAERKTLINGQFQEYPNCDDLTVDSSTR